MMDLKVRVSQDVPLTTYTTRNLEKGLLDRVRILCLLQKPQWTIEYGINEALRTGLDQLENEVKKR